MLDHLEQIHPDDLTPVEANDLVSQLTEAGVSVSRADRFDGTPGSIVLAVDRMRYEVYPHLEPKSAKLMLKTLKLLRSAGIQVYRLDRVWRTTTALFAPSRSDWNPEIEALCSTGFLRQTVVDGGRVTLLEPVAEVYLDVAVPDYDTAESAMSDWHRLQESLNDAQDGQALVRLGHAFRQSNNSEMGDNDVRAEACYQNALEYLTRATAEQDWANAQFGLGDVLSRRVDRSAAPEQRKLLERAEEAIKNSLTVVHRETDPTFWAEIQGRLADVIRHEATTTVGRKRRVDMLDDAAKSCREALRILRRDTMPEEWATAQQNLGLVLLTHAKFAQDANTSRRMLDGALEALLASLSVFTDESHAYRWARVQRAIGESCQLRADASNRPKKDDLLRQAVDAYAAALSNTTPIPLWQPTDEADILSTLSICAYALARLHGESSKEALLVQAAEAARASAAVYTRQSMPEQAAQACQLLSTIELDRTVVAEASKRLAILDEAIQADIDALNHLGRLGPRELRPQLRLSLARLYWARTTYGDQAAVRVVQKDLEETAKYVEQVLEFFTKASAPTEYQLAVRLQREARSKALTLGAVPANSRIGLIDSTPLDGQEFQ